MDDKVCRHCGMPIDFDYTYMEYTHTGTWETHCVNPFTNELLAQYAEPKDVIK